MHNAFPTVPLGHAVSIPFSVSGIFDRYFHSNRTLVITFVDYEKAFDKYRTLGCVSRSPTLSHRFAIKNESRTDSHEASHARHQAYIPVPNVEIRDELSSKTSGTARTFLTPFLYTNAIQFNYYVSQNVLFTFYFEWNLSHTKYCNRPYIGIPARYPRLIFILLT